MVLVPVFLVAAALVELAGGLSILLGCWARLGALALFLLLIPTTLIFHDFWAYEGMDRMNQMQHFMKNLTIMGGLLMVVGLGPGSFSVDARTRRGEMCCG
jgi:putative oxidoreductase